MKYLLLLLPVLAHAGEAQLACNLERTKAEVQASVLAAPQAFGSVNDSINRQATVGITQSISGRNRADLVRHAAEVRCDALRATVELENHARFALVDVQKRGALAELRSIEEAIRLAQSHIAQLDAQLAAQTITIIEHTAARQTLVALEQKQADLLRLLSKESGTYTADELPVLIERARSAEARAAGITAQAQAESGWDVRPSVGVRQSLNGGQSSSFIGLSFTYSFGYSASRDAARQVERQTEDYLAAQGGGFTQTLLRQQQEVGRLYEAEVFSEATSARQLTHLEKVLQSIDGIDTVLANNTRRALEIQLKVLQAEKNGATQRATLLKQLRDQLS